jgi:hypothetical protein
MVGEEMWRLMAIIKVNRYVDVEKYPSSPLFPVKSNLAGYLQNTYIHKHTYTHAPPPFFPQYNSSITILT